MFRESIARCNAMLYTSAETVKIPYRRDPLLAKYEGMPVPKFLQKVQEISDSFLSDMERRYIANTERRYGSKQP